MDRMLQEVPHRAARVATMHLIDERKRETSAISYSPSQRFAPTDRAKEFLAVNVYRSEFDRWLAAIVQEAGAEIQTSALVTDVQFNTGKDEDGVQWHDVVVNDMDRYRARCVVASDGVFSQASKSAGLKHRWENSDLSIMVTIDYQADPEKIEALFGDSSLSYFLGTNFPIGYIFMMEDGFHAGLGHYIKWFLDEQVSPLACLQEFLDTPAVRRIITMLDATPREAQAHCLPFLARPRPTHGSGLLVLGDAAGLICPLEAEGVYYSMMAGKLAAGTVADAKRRNDFSESALARFDAAIKASPIGREFEMGPQWKDFIDRLPFNLDAAPWIVQLLPDVVYSSINVAEPHADTTQKLAHQRAHFLARLIYPKIKQIISEPAVSLLDEFLNFYMDKFNISALLKPLMQSTRGMRENIIKQALEDWLGKKEVLPLSEKPAERVRSRLPDVITLDLRPLVPVKVAGQGITQDPGRCTGCGRCVMICPVRLWELDEESRKARQVEDFDQWCFECGACFQACPAGSINLNYPRNGAGISYLKG